MKVALVSPPFSSLTKSPPLGLGYISAVLEREGFITGILDFSISQWDTDQICGYILEMGTDLIGINVKTPTFSRVRDLIIGLRSNDYPDPIVVGGAHISALPDVSLKALDADFGVVGEGEVTMRELALHAAGKGGDPSDIKGLVYRENGSIRINAPREFIRDLDSLPFPSWRKMPPQRYFPPPELFYRRFPVATVISSRGCPFSCSYCSTSGLSLRKFRVRSAVSVVEEMRYLIRDFGVREFQFVDNCFNASYAHAIGVCEEIIRSGLDIIWKDPCGMAVKNIDERLVKLMKRSGCYELALAVETPFPEILKKNRKDTVDLENCIEKLNMIKRHGIKTYGYFMIGLYGDTRETIKKTISFAINAPIDYIVLSITQILPGSVLFNKFYKDRGKSLDTDWDEFSRNESLTVSGIPVDELRKFHKLALFMFHIKGLRIIKTLGKLKWRVMPHFLRLISDILFNRS